MGTVLEVDFCGVQTSFLLVIYPSTESLHSEQHTLLLITHTSQMSLSLMPVLCLAQTCVWNPTNSPCLHYIMQAAHSTHQCEARTRTHTHTSFITDEDATRVMRSSAGSSVVAVAEAHWPILASLPLVDLIRTKTKTK